MVSGVWMFMNMSQCVNKSNIDKAEGQRGELPLEICPGKSVGLCVEIGGKWQKSVEMKIQYLKNN